MRRVGNLFDTFTSFANLHLAWQKTRCSSGKSREAALFFQELERELFAMQEALRCGVWHPQPFRFFDIYDPKHRTIAVSAYADRVVHHALVNVLEPLYERSFIFDSYAIRKDKGVHKAVFRAQHFLQQYPFYLKTDVERFFDSVSHDRLLEILARKMKDKTLMVVCERIVRHSSLSGNRGLPIGNRTSQFFANVYLDVLDHFVKEHCRLKGYVRYMDDFVVFSHDKAALKTIKSEIEAFLGNELLLQLKPAATVIHHRQHGLPFLGRRIFPGIIRLRTENLRRITRRIALRERDLLRGDLDEAAFLHSMNSYWAMLLYYPSLGPLRKAILKT